MLRRFIGTQRGLIAALFLGVATSNCRSSASDTALATPGASPSTPTPRPDAVQVAITVDDLPVHGPLPPGIDRSAIAERLLAAFRRHGVPSVYGFVNGKRVADDPSTEAVLRLWKQAGNPLGNHTFSHKSLNAATVVEYLADLEDGEAILKKLEPAERTWKVFRYPFLYEGDTSEKRDGVRRYLREHGYMVAPVTIDADDWAFNPPFSRCATQADEASLTKLRRAFLDNHVEELRRMRALSFAIMRREVRHVLLLHIGVADADAIEDLLQAYEQEGAKWVDLPTALSDAMYGLDSGDVARYGAALPYRLGKARGIKLPPPVFARGLEEELARVCPAP